MKAIMCFSSGGFSSEFTAVMVLVWKLFVNLAAHVCLDAVCFLQATGGEDVFQGR